LKSEIEERFRRNLARVRHLTASYGQLAGRGQGRRPVNTSDILRAATVFLHATLEDFLRSIELWKLPTAPEDRLNLVPLVGLQGRPERFSLGKLAQHRGKSIDNLIGQSVQAHLDRATYNDTSDVARVLELAGVPPAHVQHHFAALAEMMKRRHQIVHQADRNEKTGRGQYQAQSLSTTSVKNWVDAVEAFVTDCLARL
jgi:hypothetical protein